MLSKRPSLVKCEVPYQRTIPKNTATRAPFSKSRLRSPYGSEDNENKRSRFARNKYQHFNVAYS